MVSYEEFIFMQFIPLTILLIFIANASRDASCVTVLPIITSEVLYLMFIVVCAWN